MEISNIRIFNGVSEPVMSGKVKRSEVYFDLPIGIPIPEFENQKIVLDAFECLISITHQHPPPKSQLSYVFKGNTFLDNDHWGRSLFTKIKIEFIHTPPVDFNTNFNEEIFERGILVVNRLLNVVRSLVTEHYVVQHIIKEDIEGFQTKHFDLNDEEIVGAGVVATTNGSLKLIVGGFNVDDNKKTEIFSMLENNITIPIHRELLRNANESLFLENYRVAIIEAESAVEVLIITILRRGFLNDGKTPEDTDKMLLSTGFKNLKNDHLKKFTHSDFTSTSIHVDWEEKCYELRNKVVHQGMPADYNKTREAIESATNAINLLEKISAITNGF
ncbi:MAG: hypothetical protein ACT4OW_07090 [Nitrososphaerota archaeon]